MNIDGLSEATLEKFISMGFIHEFADLFHLSAYREQIVALSEQVRFSAIWGIIMFALYTVMRSPIPSFKPRRMLMVEHVLVKPDTVQEAVSAFEERTESYDVPSDYGIRLHQNMFHHVKPLLLKKRKLTHTGIGKIHYRTGSRFCF